MMELVDSKSLGSNEHDEKISLLKSIFPQLDHTVISKILVGNSWNIESSIDAALALQANLSEERGTIVMQGSEQKLIANTSHALNKHSNDTGIDNKNNDKNWKSPHFVIKSPILKAKHVLPDNFLKAPRFRVIIDSISDAFTNFTIIFRRKNEKLGITVQEDHDKIVVRAVHPPFGEAEWLAIQAGVKTGDILTGINYQYFNKQVLVQDVTRMLAAQEDPVVMHFLRRHITEDYSIRLHSTPIHLCAQKLAENNFISPDRTPHISASIFRLKTRTMQWDSGWISQTMVDNQNHQIISNNTLSSINNNDNNIMQNRRISVDAGSNRYNPRNDVTSLHHRRRTVSSVSTDSFSRLSSPTQLGPNSSSNNLSQENRMYAGSRDMAVRTKLLRPALAIIILNAEYETDHCKYVIWVLDVKSGAEWFVRRRYREFYEFREVGMRIRCFDLFYLLLL